MRICLNAPLATNNFVMARTNYSKREHSHARE